MKILSPLIIGASIILGFIYFTCHVPDMAELLNYVTISKGNTLYYLHFNPPVL